MPEFGDIHEILQKLERNDGYFPRAAVAAAISRRDEIVPELLRILERTAENVETLAADVHYMAPTYAMYLLAQFQEPRAYPLLIKLFLTPGEAVMDLAGDVVTEDLGNILASVSSGDMSGMAALVENPEVNEYVRSAALKGMVALVATGQKTRQEVMDYFASLFRDRLERKPDYVWTSLVSRCVDLYPGEVYADIQQAYADDLIEGFVIRWEGVEEAYAMGKEAALEDLVNSRRYHLITDTVAELSSWACFNKEPKRSSWNQVKPVRSWPAEQAKPATSTKVGRNEPCPCGSGKKFKRCCGGG